MITPTIDLLRRLTTQMHEELGGHQGRKHTSPDLERNITELMQVLADDEVYTVIPGRTVPNPEGSTHTEGTVPNVVALGWTQLAGPLADFNRNLSRLQVRCRMSPVIGQPYAATATAASSQPCSAAPEVIVAPENTPNPTYTTSISEPETFGPAPEDEEAYWGTGEDFDWELVGEQEEFFTRETASDVALDMDDLNTLL